MKAYTEVPKSTGRPRALPREGDTPLFSPIAMCTITRMTMANAAGEGVAYNQLQSFQGFYIPYGRKVWRGIYFGGLAVLRAICQYFHPPNFLQYVRVVLLRYVINMSSTVVQNVRTLASNFEKCNENNPDLVYHQLVPASFDVLWFEMDLAVFTLLTVPVCAYVTILL